MRTARAAHARAASPDDGDVGRPAFRGGPLVDVDPDQQRRPGHRPVARGHPVERAADHEEQVGRRDEVGDLGLVRRGVDEQRVLDAEQAAGGVRRDDGRAQPPGEVGHGLRRVRRHSASAGQDHDAVRPREEADRGVDRAEARRARLGRPQRLGRACRRGQDVSRDAEIDRASRTGEGRGHGVDGRGHGLLRGPGLEHRLGQRGEERALVAALVEESAHPTGRAQASGYVARDHEHR